MTKPTDRAATMLDAAQRNFPMAEMSTYRVGGRAALALEISDDEGLAAVVGAVAATGVDVLVVGRGSNLLVADGGYDGLVLHLGDRFAAVEIDGLRVLAGAAASMPVVARRTAAAGLAGFEWAVGVPGSMGGAVRMNAGGHGSDMARSLARVRVLDLATGEDSWVPATDLDLRYRHSAIGPYQVVLAAELRLAPGDRGSAEAEIAEIVRWRREHQPGGPNAGSVFTNPPGDSAGRLIDLAGCKGLRSGTAVVSAKHANFIQVDEHGRADDVVALMSDVQDVVEAATGVRLVAETHLVGFGAELTRKLKSRPEVEG